MKKSLSFKKISTTKKNCLSFSLETFQKIGGKICIILLKNNEDKKIKKHFYVKKEGYIIESVREKVYKSHEKNGVIPHLKGEKVIFSLLINVKILQIISKIFKRRLLESDNYIKKKVNQRI